MLVLYIGKLNAVKRYKYIQILMYCAVFFIAFTSAAFGTDGFIAGVVIVIVGVIVLLLKYNTAKNIIVFKDTQIIHQIATDKEAILDYEDLKSIEFLTLPKQQSYALVQFAGSRFKVVIERADGLDLNRKDFIRFIFEKNPSVAITENSGFEKTKYFILENELKQVTF